MRPETVTVDTETGEVTLHRSDGTSKVVWKLSAWELVLLRTDATAGGVIQLSAPGGDQDEVKPTPE